MHLRVLDAWTFCHLGIRLQRTSKRAVDFLHLPKRGVHLLRFHNGGVLRIATTPSRHNGVTRKKRKMRVLQGECDCCKSWSALCLVGIDGGVCFKCAAWRRKAFSVCALYTLQGRLIDVQTSVGWDCGMEPLCAERRALFRDKGGDDPKVAVCARVRIRKGGSVSFKTGRPCRACLVAFPFYNVQRVFYSVGQSGFAELLLDEAGSYLGFDPLGCIESRCHVVVRGVET